VRPPAAWRTDRVGRLAGYLAASGGWRRRGWLFLLGALSGFALPPFHLVPLLIPAFTGLIWVLAGSTTRCAAFGAGWWFALGQNVVGLYWIGIAMTVDLARFWWFIPISVGGLSAGLALFVGLATLLVRWSGARGAGRVLLFTAAWLLTEVARSSLLGGFPWNLVGSVWAFAALPLQPAAWLGVWGLSAATVLAAAAPAVLAEGKAGRLGLPLFAAAGLVALAGASWLRLEAAPRMPPADAPLLRLVQPSTPQEAKWDPQRAIEVLRRQVAMSRQAGFEDLAAVIWPETAVPYFLDRDPGLRQELAAAAAPPGGLLLTGALGVSTEEGQDRIFNSLFVLDGRGAILDRFDKVHLVPFGEYVPFRSVLGLAKVTAGSTDFTPGPGAATVAPPGLPPFSPLICYEVIFSGQLRAAGSPQPDWLLNITNDAWFGRSSGPYQHFAAARLRAVEEGLPLVRAANNGISASIDAYGRVTGILRQDAVAVLDVRLSRPVEGGTLYARLGRWLAPLVVVVLLLVAFLIHRYHFR